MIKMFLVFVAIFALFFLGIKTVMNLTSKGVVALTKSIGYSILVSLAAVMLMTVLVILF